MGAVSRLAVSRPGQPDLAIRQLTPGIPIFRLVDPAYDELDETFDDFLGDVADIVNSADRQESILKYKDPDAGPWERRYE